jgi:hypothetical protein
MRAAVRFSMWTLSLLIASLGQVAAAGDSDVFPLQLRSVWEPGRPCDSSEASDRDSRFRITERQRLNYEESEDIISTRLLTDSPLTWRIVTTSDVGPADLDQPRIYVLQGDLLAISDGQSARMYMRCK